MCTRRRCRSVLNKQQTVNSLLLLLLLLMLPPQQEALGSEVLLEVIGQQVATPGL